MTDTPALNDDLVRRLKDPLLWQKDEMEYLDPLCKEAATALETLAAERVAELDAECQQSMLEICRERARAEAAEARLAQAERVPAVTEAQREAFCRELAMLQYEGGFRDRDIEPYADRLLAALQQSAAGEEGKP